MAATIPSWIVGLRGQCVKRVVWDESRDTLVFQCDRDRRFVPVDHRTGARGTVNRRLRREVQDLPVWGRPVVLSVEYCQLKIGATDRRMERLSFVGNRLFPGVLADAIRYRSRRQYRRGMTAYVARIAALPLRDRVILLKLNYVALYFFPETSKTDASWRTPVRYASEK